MAQTITVQASGVWQAPGQAAGVLHSAYIGALEEGGAARNSGLQIVGGTAWGFYSTNLTEQLSLDPDSEGAVITAQGTYWTASGHSEPSTAVVHVRQPNEVAYNIASAAGGAIQTLSLTSFTIGSVALRASA